MQSNINRSELPPDIVKLLNSEANVFFSNEYESFIRSNGDFIIYIFDQNFILPLSYHKKHIFSFGNFLSEPYKYSVSETDSETERNFINNVMDFLKKSVKLQWLTTTPASSFFTVYPDRSKRIRFGSHVIDLTKDEEALFADMKSKHRNMIRRAEKAGVSVKIGGKELLDTYLKLDTETWERSGVISNNKSIYEKILDNLKTTSFIAIAYKDEIPQSGMLCCYNKAMMYYLFAASKKSPEPGSTNLLHWKVMKYMKSLGVLKYSFVGCRINEDENSKYHNIQRFKEGFGGELKEGYLFKAKFNCFMYLIFHLLYKIRAKKELLDVIDQEISKWKSIN